MATDISQKRKKKNYKKRRRRKVLPIFISKTKFERTKNKTKEKEKFDPKNTRFKTNVIEHGLLAKLKKYFVARRGLVSEVWIGLKIIKKKIRELIINHSRPPDKITSKYVSRKPQLFS